MQQLASDLNESKRQSFVNLAIADRITEIFRQMAAYGKIFQGGYRHLILGRITIMPADHATVGLQRGSFRAVRSRNGKRLRPRVHVCGFMENVRYCPVLLLSERLSFFLFAAGAGKSVFWYVKHLSFLSRKLILLGSSTIIEDIISMRKAGLASIAFFYCDFREEEKMGLRGLISSLLSQLCHQSDPYCDMLSKFYSEHTKDMRPPSEDELAGCLKDLLKLPGAPVYIIVDALDECPNISSIPSPRSKVLNLLEDLIGSKFSNLYICVTSRPEADIKDVLDPLIFLCVSLHDQSEQKKDIEEYIKSVINTHSTSRRWKAEHKELVVDVLTEKADGM